MTRSRIHIFVLAGILIACAWLYYPKRAGSFSACKKFNVILISIDTLRADHLSAYGYERNTSPNIDRFAADSVLFETVVGQAPSTAPSHASIFTSLLPVEHGAFVSRDGRIKDSVPTIAEILSKQGYQTASFNGGGQIDKRYGFARGFDIYQSYSGSDYENEKLDDRLNESLGWLRNQPDPFFLFLHSYEIHSPYAPDRKQTEKLVPGYKGELTLPVSVKILKQINSGKIKINESDLEFIKAAYDAELISADAAFGKLISYLKQNSLYDKTMIILTSDHGEEFGEHGKVGWHSHTLYDELLLVPLIIKFPNQQFAGRRIDTQVRGIDIQPTILETLGMKPNPAAKGKSLITLIKNPSEDFEAYAVSQRDMKKGPPTSVRTKDWKLYKQSLFDLKNDPGEKKNVAKKFPERKKELRDIVDKLRSAEESDQMEEKEELDPQTIEQLKTLGYL